MIEHTGDFASGALFQSNVIQSANTGEPWFSDDTSNPVGNPTRSVEDALTYFAIDVIRFPGGATKAVFENGMMVDGSLPENIQAILAFSQGKSISVHIVVPVDTPDGMTRTEFLSQISQFAAAVEQQFPGVVKGYELGNEYWSGRAPLDASLEFDYGVKAASTALALSQGMIEAGYDADIYLQASGNLRGAFGNNADLANGVIQKGFESIPGAKDVLDGVVRNNYWRDPDLDGFENDSGPFAEDRGLELNLTGDLYGWATWLGRDLLTLVGEYNINRNIGFGEGAIDMGVHGASYMLEHVSNMIDAGVDMAFAWPLVHNTQNAYIFRGEEITSVLVRDICIATNSTRVAMLDLMRQTITSHELIDARWSFDGMGNSVEVTLFEDIGGPQANEGERIVFISSRSPESLTFSADFSAFVGK